TFGSPKSSARSLPAASSLRSRIWLENSAATSTPTRPTLARSSGNTPTLLVACVQTTSLRQSTLVLLFAWCFSSQILAARFSLLMVVFCNADSTKLFESLRHRANDNIRPRIVLILMHPPNPLDVSGRSCKTALGHPSFPLGQAYVLVRAITSCFEVHTR